MLSAKWNFRLASWLCSSPLINNLIVKALDCQADIVHYDLEDSVPFNKKVTAREALLNIFENLPNVITALRINSLSTIDGLKDLQFLLENKIRPNIIILPKSLLDGDVSIANSILNTPQHEKRIKIFAVIETIDSFCRMRNLSTCPIGLDGVIFGSADFAVDLGITPGQSDLSRYMSDIALFAKNFGIIAIDSPCFKIGNLEKLQREIDVARSLGFIGKIAIHPSQVKLINQRFSPLQNELAEANKIIQSQKPDNSSTIVCINEDVFGPPFVRHAENIINQIKEFGEKSEEH